MKKFLYFLLIPLLFSTIKVSALTCSAVGQNGVSVGSIRVDSTTSGNVAGYVYYSSLSSDNGYITLICDTTSGPSESEDLLYQNVIVQGVYGKINSVSAFSGFGSFSSVVKPVDDFFPQLVGSYDFGFGSGHSGYSSDNGFVYGFSAISTTPAKISFRVFVPNTSSLTGTNQNGLIAFYTYDKSFEFIQGGPATNITNIINYYNSTNENYNTQSIIDNQNDNAQNIIDNQNDNTQQQIESQKACTIYDKSSAVLTGYLSSYGSLVVNSNANSTASDFIPISSTTTITALLNGSNNRYTCFYNQNKVKISCINGSDISANYVLTIPNDATYFRYSCNNNGYPKFNICKDGNQALQDSLNDDNVGGASKDATDFFSNFSTNNHGLTSIITAPLNAITSITSATCSPLVLPLPFVNEDLELPCMRSLYVQHFGGFMTIYDIIVTGIISYWVLVKIFALVKDFKNPQHDEVEVMEL